MFVKKLLILMLVLSSLAIAGCDTLSSSANEKSGDKAAQTEVKQISFVVYRAAADGSEKLLPEKITMADNGISLPENALNTLITTAPKSDKMDNVVPENTRVLSLKVDKDGTAYADFSKEIAKRGQGSYNEFMLTGAIVNTLTEFPEIKQVQILVEGKKVITLSGHMDVEDPLKRNTTLLGK